MDLTSLTDPQHCADFFRQSILVNLQYWHESEAVKSMDLATLDQEREGLVRAVTFALSLEEAWSTVYNLIQRLTPYMEKRGHWETWSWVLEQAVTSAERMDEPGNIMVLSLWLARLSQRQSQFRRAVKHYRQTIRLARRLEDENTEGRALSNLGYLYLEQGHWCRAEVMCCHALSIFERLGNAHGRAHTENHLGLLYIRQHRWEQAEQCLEQACSIWQQIDDQHGLIYGLINLGLLNLDLEQPEQALDYLEKAHHQTQITGEITYLGEIFLNLGLVYLLKEDWVETEASLIQAKDIFRQFSNQMELARAWRQLGVTYLRQQKWEEARSYLETSFVICCDLQHKPGEVSTSMYLIECELATQNYERAAGYIKFVEYLLSTGELKAQDNYLRSRLATYRDRLPDHIILSEMRNLDCDQLIDPKNFGNSSGLKK